MGRPLGSKNKNSLTKRTALVEAPKSLPMRGKEAAEPDTYLCKGPETAATRTAYLLGKCTSCNMFESNSEIDHLCLNCHRDAAGLEFDEDTKRWVKKNKGRKIT